MEFLAGVLVRVFFRFLGAGTRWMFMGFKKPYKDVLNDGKHHSDGFIGLVVLFLLLLPFIISNTIKH